MKFNSFALTQKDAINPPNSLVAKLRSRLRKSFLSSAYFFSHKNSVKSKFLRGLYCHYVFDDQLGKFEKILKEFLEIGKFVNTDTLIKILNGEKEIDDKYFHLSFDDGFKNIYKNAFPILKKYNIPAITFLPTNFIESDFETLKTYSLDIAAYGGVIETMNWDEVNKMIDSGYEFGSHTCTHADLAKISHDSDFMFNEVFKSKHDIEKKTGTECKYIAWPFGEFKHINDKSLEYIKNAGYYGCFGAFRGSIRKGTDRFMIPRHHFEVEWPMSHIKYFAKGKFEKKI